MKRFWEKVDTSGECWEWTAYRDSKGYGRVAVDRVPMLAHRFSWQLANGEIPEGMNVCHRCDNPPCVRPDHLFLGTDADNLRDMREKGRGAEPPHPTGLAHHNAVITDKQVRSARVAYDAGLLNQKQIATTLGVSPSTVREWVSGRSRPEAGGPIVRPRPRRVRAA